LWQWYRFSRQFDRSQIQEFCAFDWVRAAFITKQVQW
jgi:hypothetical protein